MEIGMLFVFIYLPKNIAFNLYPSQEPDPLDIDLDKCPANSLKGQLTKEGKSVSKIWAWPADS